MISQVTFYVKHGESTDEFDAFVRDAITMSQDADYLEDITVFDYDVKIDLPNLLVPGCRVHTEGKFDARCTCEDN